MPRSPPVTVLVSFTLITVLAPLAEEKMPLPVLASDRTSLPFSIVMVPAPPVTPLKSMPLPLATFTS